MPAAKPQEPLLAKAHELARSATQLAGLPVASELRTLLRGMNSYYTNRIEGQHTRPHEIEQALRQDFSHDRNLAARQRLAVAHIDAEAAVEARYVGDAGAARLYSIDAVQDLHRELFARLPAADLVTPEGEPIVPGRLRARDVRVGEHVAPTHASLAAFLRRWAMFYRGVRRGEAALVALAAAHHGDLDGRGNLSERALVAWIDDVLDICLDQVRFMTGLLDLSAMERRIAACLVYEEQTLRSGVRFEALRPLHYLFLTGGELERGEFKTMTGLGDRTAVGALSALVKRGLLKSDTPQGKVRFGIPLHALRFYFPALWPEAEADAEGR